MEPRKVPLAASLLAALLIALPLPASPSPNGDPEGASSETSRDSVRAVFAPYGELLDAHVIEYRLPGNGLASAFDYQAAIGEAQTQALLRRQQSRLDAFDPDTLDDRDAALAFWINAYNYFMLAWLLENPIDGALASSVRDYGHLLDPYALFGRALFRIGGRDYSLRQIELDILLGEDFAARGWKEARVHFMVNCASVGCPALRREPYTRANIEQYLAENTRRALATPLHLRRDGTELWVTSLFDWYANDFVEEAGSVRGFIERHGGDAARSALAATESVRYIDYDWSLNTPGNTRRVLDALASIINGPPGAEVIAATR